MEKEIMHTAREAAVTIFKAAVTAVQPEVLMRRNVQRSGHVLHIAGHTFTLPAGRPVWVFGAGKAAAAMAQALEGILDGLSLQGLAITKYGHSLPLAQVQLAEAGHPLPDHNGVTATRRMVALLRDVQLHDPVLFLLSGGASALLADYPPGATLEQTQAVFDLLLKSGADIHEMNTVRKHLSAVKGGQLALLAQTDALCSLVLSDVVGDDLSVIGSGPTVPDPSTFADALTVLEKYRLTAQLPAPVLHHLQQGLAGQLPDTPKPGHPRFNTIYNCLVGSNHIALEAAAARARELGYAPYILSSTATGNAHTLAAQLVQEAVNWQGPRPACLLMGGESTVTVTGKGLGGRNQQLALAAGMLLQDHPHITLLSAGTDGTDGPTDAAGAVADAALMEAAAQQGLDAAKFLQDNNAYRFFEQAGGLIKTGPTQTNVMDVMAVIIHSLE